MADLINADVIAALLGLLTLAVTTLAAMWRAQKQENSEQGDIGFDVADALWSGLKAYMALSPKYEAKVKEADAIYGAIKAGWNDSATKTPEMDEYREQFIELFTELWNAYMAEKSG
jgi:hypothetical protein